MKARLTGVGGTVLSGPVRSGPVRSGLKTTDHRPQTTDHSHQPSVVTGEYDEQAVVIASGQRIRCCLKNPQDFIPAPPLSATESKGDPAPSGRREKGEGPEEGVLPHLTVPAMSRRSGLKTGESFYY